MLMKKPNEKKIKEILNNVELNFTDLVNAAIWYEMNDMEDWATEISGEIEKITPLKEVELLIKDFTNRTDKDFEAYIYQRLWWALFNEKDESVNKVIIDFCRDVESGSKFVSVLKLWCQNLDNDSITRPNINDILKSVNKPRP